MPLHRLNIDELNKVVQIWKTRTGKTDEQFCMAVGRNPTWLANIRAGARKDGWSMVQARSIRILVPVFKTLDLSIDSVLDPDDDIGETFAGDDDAGEEQNPTDTRFAGSVKGVHGGPPEGRRPRSQTIQLESQPTTQTDDESTQPPPAVGAVREPPTSSQGSPGGPDIPVGLPRVSSETRPTNPQDSPGIPVGHDVPAGDADAAVARLLSNDELSDLIGEVFDDRFGHVVKSVQAIADSMKATLDRMPDVLGKALDDTTRHRAAEAERPAEPVVVHRDTGTTIITIHRN